MSEHENRTTKDGVPKVVIVGAGFGGLFAAKRLAGSPVEVTIVDRRNHHLFQPLLYQVSTAALSPADIAWPIRSVFSRHANVTVRLGEVDGVDVERRRIRIGDARLDYDVLVLATGARDGYFGNDAWAEHTLGLKTLDDATEIRRRLLLAFERAELATDPAEREALMRFVVIGGGPTGVELAGSISELARYALARDFRRIDPTSADVVLIEAGPRLLPTYSEASSAYALEALANKGVRVRLDTRVTDCGAHGVTLGEERVGAATVLWAAGVEASPAGRWLGAETDRSGRTVVEPDLSVPGHPEIFVIGDTASAVDADGTRVPGIAPAAKQQGRHVAAVILARATGRAAPPPFRYRHAGDLATIGRQAGVADFARFRLQGAAGWWLWGLAHVYFLIGFASPILVCLRWLFEYVTYKRGARLITGDDRAGELEGRRAEPGRSV